MAIDAEFMGEVIVVSETQLGARVSDELIERLEGEWHAAGSPKPLKRWLRGRLEALFPCAGERPRWVQEDDPDWQYHNGEPMTFLGQMDVPAFTFPGGRKSGPITIFSFAAAEPCHNPPGSWEMVVKTVEQDRDD